uniref:Uncharacterized protein n=1 Tax=Arundo donax TaxID=35708 RepID=A0A0A8XVQ9_ARUDO
MLKEERRSLLLCATRLNTNSAPDQHFLLQTSTREHMRKMNRRICSLKIETRKSEKKSQHNIH